MKLTYFSVFEGGLLFYSFQRDWNWNLLNHCRMHRKQTIFFFCIKHSQTPHNLNFLCKQSFLSTILNFDCFQSKVKLTAFQMGKNKSIFFNFRKSNLNHNIIPSNQGNSVISICNFTFKFQINSQKKIN